MNHEEIHAHNVRIKEKYMGDFVLKFGETAHHLQEAEKKLLEQDLETAARVFEENPVIRNRKGDQVPQDYLQLGKLIKPEFGAKKTAPNVRERDKFEVFRRDHYQCRYTGIKLITHPMLELLSYLLPSHFPYDNPPSGSDKGSKNTHLLVWVLWPSVDHIIPVSQGGLNEMSNYTTANSKFNMFNGNILNEHLGLEFLDAADKNWKGLEDEYQSLLIKYRDQVPLSRLPKLENWAMLMR
jgi:hypothetical protein